MNARTVRSQDFQKYVPYALTRSSDGLGWRGFRAEVVRGHSSGELSLPPLDHHLVNVILAVPTVHVHRWDGAERTELGREGAVSLVPAGRASYWRWRYAGEGTPCDFHLHLEPEFVRRVAVERMDRMPAGTEFRAELCFYDAEVRGLAELLARELERGGVNGPLYAESLGTAMVAVLLRLQDPWRAGRGAPAERPREPREQRERMRAVCAYIEAHLGEELHLEELAEMCGLGAEQFRRVFRAALGRTPHRYVMEQRVTRARQMLRGGEGRSLTEVALRLGFADHSHFAATFRRLTGVTPSAFRRERVGI